jgi:putative transcriptional regulator
MLLRRPGLAVVKVPDDLDVREIRLACCVVGGRGATQQSFAYSIGVPVRTLRVWEQRRRRPTGAARVLLAMVARYPWVVFDALNDQLPRDKSVGK